MAFDSNNLVLTNVGLQYLQAHKLAGTKARLGNYKLGSSNLFVPTENDISIFGTQTYIGLTDEIFWIKYSENEVVIRCCVESDKGDFDIGCIGIYSDTNELLFIAKFDYIHRKMRTKDDNREAGGRWTFQFRLMMEDLFTLWEFDNITPKYAEMDELTLATSSKRPFDSFYTELHLNDSFLPTNREGYFHISGNVSRQWFTSPFQMSEAYVTVYGRYEVGGGAVGDGHGGIW
jgi:hypothetical protein